MQLRRTTLQKDKHNEPSTNDVQSRNTSRKTRNPSRKRTTTVLTESPDEKTAGGRFLINETTILVVTDDPSVLESCTTPDLDLTEKSLVAVDTSRTVEVPIFHQWLPEGRVCRRASREELENLSDETFERRHRRHEKAEKAARNRERERFEHESWQQQVARDKLVHLTINHRLPVSPPRPPVPITTDKHPVETAFRDFVRNTSPPPRSPPSSDPSVAAQERSKRLARRSKRAEVPK